jgi:hypothetical protein
MPVTSVGGEAQREDAIDEIQEQFRKYNKKFNITLKVSWIGPFTRHHSKKVTSDRHHIHIRLTLPSAIFLGNLGF